MARRWASGCLPGCGPARSGGCAPHAQRGGRAQEAGVARAIRDQERAGLDIITDGEIRRESYSNHFANALEGIDLEHPGTIRSRAGTAAPLPRVTAPTVPPHPA